MKWRLAFTAAGVTLGGLGLIGLRYALTPGFRLDPSPGFAVSLALIAIGLAVWCFWLAWRE
ncbi:hypothetical protein [Phenylobacterium aquaticum]|uniref:hypothetical protein n=1 Tax=Phenylobacterium aquaticum TaxID=1763816 RepID=UPI001F5C46AE|nr:hypothetical protein [Phenylobacterium aquaticum]MCI3132844.1 hypothetical protein [Phenylobacterium aquaticum]